MNAFDEESREVVFHYLPHHNCNRLAEWLGEEPVCDGEGDSDHTYTLPDGQELEPDDWVFRQGDEFRVVSGVRALDTIFAKVLHRAHLIA